MLTMYCNRCERKMADIALSSPHPGSKFSPPVFDERRGRLEEMGNLDLCERCARDLVAALVTWLPAIGDAQMKWNQKAE